MYPEIARQPETPEGSDAAENPIRLPTNVHYNQAEFS